jgi:hypothetical protein
MSGSFLLSLEKPRVEKIKTPNETKTTTTIPTTIYGKRLMPVNFIFAKENHLCIAQKHANYSKRKLECTGSCFKLVAVSSQRHTLKSNVPVNCSKEL